MGSTADGSVDINADFTGKSTAISMSGLQGTTRFNGGVPGTPQLIEVMGQDLGNVISGFNQNFAFGTVVLPYYANAKVVDSSNNAPGSGAEAMYA